MRRIIEDGQKKGRLPTREQLDALKGAPHLDIGAMRILHVYDDLSIGRDSGMGRGSVPIEAVLTWSGHTGMDYETTNHLWRVIRLVDAAIRRRQAGS